MPTPRPPFDPELAAALVSGDHPTVTADTLPALAANRSASSAEVRAALESWGITIRDHVIPGHQGDDIVVSTFAKVGHTGRGPCIFHAHGGGMITGNRFGGVLSMVDWIDAYDAVVVSVEYRLAPEFPDPYPIEDCYAALVWTVTHADELGIDLGRVLVAGGSAGGGLAAGTALLARDRCGPALIGQLLLCPMLDDRDVTLSARQYQGIGTWDRQSNATAWAALLGDRVRTEYVSIYAAPARAADLAGLPPAYIDCGSAEVFRDEDVAYAKALWAAGVQAELHVWAGGYHGFTTFAPEAAVSRAAKAARDSWISRVLGRR